jgi:hypothetical protein
LHKNSDLDFLLGNFRKEDTVVIVTDAACSIIASEFSPRSSQRLVLNHGVKLCEINILNIIKPFISPK